MKHNISITVDQKLFREIENTRGREKRSTFIEYLIASGLKNYKNDTPTAKGHQTPFGMLSSASTASLKAASTEVSRLA